jgi:hypothetical protein
MPLENHPTDPDKYVYKSRQYQIDCPHCEYHKQRAQIWRDEAYKLSGHPLPRKETSMTQDEIIELARQVGLVDWESSAYRNELQAFAKLVAAKEREACMKACEKTITSQRSAWGANFCIEAIRARGQA